MRTWMVALMWVGCAGQAPTDETELRPVDADNDGFASDVDCDDEDPTIRPDADEVCDPNNVDEDCDGLSDDADEDVDLSTGGWFYRDADGDGFGDPADAVRACDPGGGYIEDHDDCDDTNPNINPDSGCLGPFDGEWDTTINLTVQSDERGVDVVCTAQDVLTVDSSRPHSQVRGSGPWACQRSDGVTTLTIDGNFADEDRIAGSLVILGDRFDFEADFSGDTLTGGGRFSGPIDGVDYEVSHTIDGRRR